MTSKYLHRKRAVDVAVAFAGLIAVSPVLAVTAVVVKLDSDGPVFFLQERVGLKKQTFTIRKFRSMTVDHGTTSQTLNTSAGVTRVGRLIRRAKIDELPQLWNVLVGDMSLVGPRPMLPSLLVDVPQWAHRRFDVRPGITGLAQVSGNVALPWVERWRLDVDYVDSLSWKTDLSIIWRTGRAILQGEAKEFRAEVGN